MSKGNQVITSNYIAVLNALSEYCQALDAQDADSLKKLFTNDASIKVPLVNKVFTGSAGVEEFVQMVKGKVKPGTLHHESNVVIGNSNQWFTNVSYWQCVSNGRIVSYGKHDDVLHVDQDGKAKFVSRSIIHIWTDKAAHAAPAAPAAAATAATAAAVTTGDANSANGAAKKRRRRGGRRRGGKGGAGADSNNAADTQPTNVAAAASSVNPTNKNAKKNVEIDPNVSVFVVGYEKSNLDASLAALKALFAKFGPHEIIMRTGHSFVVYQTAAAANDAIAEFIATPPSIGKNTLTVERPRNRSNAKQPEKQPQNAAPQQS